MIKRLLYAAAIVIAAAACSKQVPPENTDQPLPPEKENEAPETAVFTAVTEGASSKTVLAEDGEVFHVLWADGDRIDINGTTLTLSTESLPAGYGPGTSKGLFTGSNPSGYSTSPVYKAVYPSTLRDKYGYYNLPAEQSYTPGSPAGFPMYAESDGQSLSFKNLCGIIQLNIKGEKSVRSIALADKGPSPLPMSGRFNVSGDAAVISTGTDGTSLICSTPVALSTESFTSFFITVPAGTYGKLQIIIEASDDSMCTLSSKNAITVERSKVTTINLSSPTFKDDSDKITYVMYDGYTDSTGNTGTYQYPGGADASVFGDGLTVSSHTYDSATKTGVITLSGKVTRIGYYAFRGASYIKSITIPNTVTSIGERAFGECGRLESLNFPRSVTTIGANAFVNDYEFTVPDLSHVTSIGEAAFQSVKAGTIVIGENITSLGNQVFQHGSVEEVIINHMPASMGTSVFHNCDKLTTVEINDGTSIPNYTFDNCDKLESVNLFDGITAIGEGAFQSCKALESITLPANLQTIGKNAFKYCNSLASIVFPESLTSIGQESFESCTSLTAVSIPGNVTYFYRAFRSCTSLQSVVFPVSSTFTKIANSAFDGCTNLTTTSIPANVTKIEQAAFRNCGFTQLPEGWDRAGISYDSAPFEGCPVTSITFPDHWTTVPASFCIHMAQLSEVHLGTGVTCLGGSAFRYCTSLNGGTNIIIPSQVNRIEGQCFANCGFTILPEGINRKGIVFTGSEVFMSNPFTSLEIIDWDTIPTYCFRNCSQLTGVVIDGVESTAGGILIECSALQQVDFGDDITSIGYDCFNGDSALMTIIIRNTAAVASLSTRLRAGIPGAPMPLIYVPSALLDSYKAAASWSQYADYIHPLDGGAVGGNIEDYNNGGNL